MRFQLICVLGLLCFAVPVQGSFAQGMQYTAMGKEKSKRLSPRELTMKSLNFQQEEEERQALETKDKEEKEAMDAVWERYRDLAQGKRDKSQKPRPARPEKPKKVSVEKPSLSSSGQDGAPPQKKGIGILDQYEQHKARRSQMKVITLNRPAPAKADSEKAILKDENP